MKKFVLLVTFCTLIIIGGMITTYIYMSMQDHMVYKNSLFVSKEVSPLYGDTSYLY